MDDFYTIDDIRLTEAQKDRMRSVVHAYMELKPVRRSGPSVRRSGFSWHMHIAHPALALIAVFAILGSSAGVSYAAEAALPGDLLYPVKVGINEPVRGALAVSAQAKTAWAISVAGERAKEAVTLAAEKRLDPGTQTELETSLVEHAEIASRALDSQTTDAPQMSAQAAARFEARLSEYERLIASVGEDDGDSASALAAAIRAQRDTVATVRDRAEQLSGDDAEDTDLHQAAKERLAATDRLARLNAAAFSTSTADAIAANLETASTTLASLGMDAAEHASSSRDDVRKALRDSERIATFVEASAAIHQRTGLVIDDSRKDSRDRSRRSKEVPVPAAAMMMQAAPAIAPAPDASGEDGERRSEGEQERHDEDSHGHVLDLSVPDL